MHSANRRRWISLSITTWFALFSKKIYAIQSVRLLVKGKSNKDTETNNGRNTRSKKEIESYTLNINLQNTGPSQATYTLEWYFLSRRVTAKSKSEPEVFDCGSKQITLASRKGINIEVTSKDAVKQEHIIYINRGGWRGHRSSNAKKTVSGSEYCAYVVLVRSNGKIIAKQSNSKTFLKPEFLNSLHPTMHISGHASIKKQPSKKKKNKKRKKR